MSDEARKVERQKELEEKKARLEAYRNKRRLDTKDSAVPSAAAGGSKAAPPSVDVDQVLAQVLAGGGASPVAAATMSPQTSAAVAVTATGTLTPTQSSSVADVVAAANNARPVLEVRRGIAVHEGAPRVLESYTRTVLVCPVEDEPAAAAVPTQPQPQPEVVQGAPKTVDTPASSAEQWPLLSAQERDSLLRDAAVMSWADRASEVTERWLNVGASRLVHDLRGSDFGDGAEGSAKGASLLEVEGAAWVLPKLEGSVLDVMHSPHTAELFGALYVGGALDDGQQPGGVVALWTLDRSLDRPLSVFRSEGRLTRACFSTFHSWLLVASTYSGGLAVWDMRAGGAPVAEAPSQGHPITALHCVGTSHAPQLHTVSSDGKQQSWSLNAVHAPPLSVRELRAPVGGALAPTCASFGVGETDAFVVGTESGRLYRCQRSADEIGAELQLHTGPIHSAGAVVATGGADWAVHVVNTSNLGQTLTVQRSGPTYALQWGPHPSGGGKGGVAALDVATCRELASAAASASPVTSLALTPQLLLAGDLDGTITAYRPHSSLLVGSDHAWSAVAAALEQQAKK